WLRAHMTQHSQEQWLTQTFSSEPALAWQQTLQFAQTVGGEQRLHQLHAALGPRGRIFTLSAPLHNADAAHSWISWQLDRHCSPADALAACGAHTAWGSASPLFQRILGRSITPQVGPWSIAWTLDEHNPNMRIVTTAWARTLEE